MGNIIIMKLIHQCEQWFKDEGYRSVWVIPNSLLSIKYQGYNILIPDNGNDESFLKVDLRFGSGSFEKDRVQLLEAASAVCKQRKVVKVYIEDDNDVIFTTEILLDTTPQVEDVLPRLLDMLMQSVHYFVEKLPE